jgi:hypothetical protein
VVGVARGVVQRDLRAVGDAVQDELVVAALGPQRLEVVDARGGRELAAAHAELRGAAACDVGERQARQPAGQRRRRAGAALVEDEQVARRERGRDDGREVGGQRDRRLAGAARERDDRTVRRVARRDEPLGGEMDRAGNRAAAIQRDVEPAALHPRGGGTGGVGHRGVRGRRREQEQARGDEHSLQCR